MYTSFIGKEAIEELGEIITCVYIHIKYEVVKAKQYMLWLGFRNDLLIEFEGMLFFYQKDELMPRYNVEGEFYKIVSGADIWESFPSLPDYKYRTINDGIICISYLPVQ